jgi:methyltransferase (TIGR00027 family)
MSTGPGSTDQGGDISGGVGQTAVLVAACRAIETSRPDALTRDLYAAGFVAAVRDQLAVPVPLTLAQASASPDARTWLDLTEFVAVRTRTSDEFFARAAAAGIRQAVILAAGLDARAFRLSWPAGFALYELDQPGVLDFKSRVLTEQPAQPACQRREVGADLRQDWTQPLAAAGFSAAEPTAWLAEGLLSYLDRRTAHALLAGVVRLSAPGSRVMVEDFPDLSRTQEETVMGTTGRAIGVHIPDLLQGGGWAGEPPVRPETELAGPGWQVSVLAGGDAAAGLGRPQDETAALSHVVYVFAERG